MSNEETPLPQLQPNPPKKRKGRPKGSKNKRPSRRRRLLDIAAVDVAFEAAFGGVPPDAEPSQPTPSPQQQEQDEDHRDPAAPASAPSNDEENEDEVNFHLQILEANNDDDNISIDEKEEDEIGFGAADMYDVRELLEIGKETKDEEDEEDDPEKVMNSLKHGCVADSSLRSYNLSLVTFITYIYKFDKQLLQNSWIRAINSFTYGVQDEKKLRQKMKRTIKQLLVKADESCPPINLQEYSAKHFIKYLISLRSAKGERLSSSSYSNKRSALFHMFRMYAVKQSAQFDLELTTMFKGLKRQLAKEKQHGKGKIQTGKSPIPYALFRRINYYYLLENSTEAIFARAFLCVTWNLVCRASNTVTIHLHHLSWSDDCLCIYFAQMKNDQTGDRKRDPRHVYANPHDVLVCPITALAMYISIFNVTGSKDSALFPGSNQYKRFAKSLEKILFKHKIEIKAEFGIEVSDLGVHSLRKGAAGYISSGSTCAPPQVATNLRAGWTMGVIQDTYLKYEAAGDQYVGRVVCGLPLCSAKFAVLPPQLLDCSIEECEKMVKCIFPGIMSHLHCACKFFAASLLFHYKRLKNIISPQHPLLIASFFTSTSLHGLFSKISVSYAWEEESMEIDIFRGAEEQDQSLLSSSVGSESGADQNSPLGSDGNQVVPIGDDRRIRKATGIPAHVILMADMQRVVRSQQEVLLKLREVISTELDKRQVGHSTFQVQSQVEDMLKSFERRVISKFDELKPIDEDGLQKNNRQSAPGGGHWYHWGGQYRRVPLGYQFPNKMTVKNAWLRYFLPDVINNITAMRYLTCSDLSQLKTGRRNLSSYKMVMQFLIAEAKKKNIYIDNPTEDEANEMFAQVSGAIFSLHSNKRSESFSWHTHVRPIQKHKKKLKELQ